MPPNLPPPPSFEGAPRPLLLSAGTVLTRLHHAAFDVAAFNPIVARDTLEGGRFDGTPEDPYGFLYAASDDATAVAEALLRELPIDERGGRLLQRRRLNGLRIGWLRTTRDLELVSLRSGLDLAALGQDAWLTVAPAAEYAMTRRWAAAIRTWDTKAAGLSWRSRREPDGIAYVFFADRCPDAALAELRDGTPLPLGDRDLTIGAARSYLEDLLAAYRVVLT